MPLPLIKILAIAGWAVIQLGVEAIKSKNLNKQMKLQESKDSSNTKTKTVVKNKVK